ncbi:unnamed protein product [Linum tenue]|uniref:Uncharacterized protein n=1 Tax=Linum tenue TaxID=586396 RepID=A0AAV0LLY3_9ROSI|nr:unnamed protein product [Linum tenue]
MDLNSVFFVPSSRLFFPPLDLTLTLFLIIQIRVSNECNFLFTALNGATRLLLCWFSQFCILEAVDLHSRSFLQLLRPASVDFRAL